MAIIPIGTGKEPDIAKLIPMKRELKGIPGSSLILRLIIAKLIPMKRELKDFLMARKRRHGLLIAKLIPMKRELKAVIPQVEE